MVAFGLPDDSEPPETGADDFLGIRSPIIGLHPLAEFIREAVERELKRREKQK